MNMKHLPAPLRGIAEKALDQLAAQDWIPNNRGRVEEGSVHFEVDGETWQISLVFAPLGKEKIIPVVEEQRDSWTGGRM